MFSLDKFSQAKVVRPENSLTAFVTAYKQTVYRRSHLLWSDLYLSLFYNHAAERTFVWRWMAVLEQLPLDDGLLIPCHKSAPLNVLSWLFSLELGLDQSKTLTWGVGRINNYDYDLHCDNDELESQPWNIEGCKGRGYCQDWRLQKDPFVFLQIFTYTNNFPSLSQVLC